MFAAQVPMLLWARSGEASETTRPATAIPINERGVVWLKVRSCRGWTAGGDGSKEFDSSNPCWA